ncbi:HTTM domain-containing protein [Nannocystis pusilla]|uniref:HTTM domain-containing protein n=1 Tax=Nannocystis pusilla TaxID=889268 RepID=UPI003DA4489C
MSQATGPQGHGLSDMLSRAARAADRWYRPVAPPERLAALRLLVGGFAVVYLAARLPNLLGLYGLGGFRPVGVVSLLATPLPPAAVLAQALVALLLGLAFALGLAFRVTGPAFALVLLWVLSYRNAWGMIFHTENLLVMHVLALGCSRAADAWSLDARRARRRGAPPPVPSTTYGWPVRLLALLTVGSYFIAGVAKLRLSGLGWATSDLLRNYIAYDNLRKHLLGDWYSPLGAWLVGHAWLFPPLATASLLLELLAPVALLGPRFARVWSLLAWTFHFGVWAIMAIFFPYPLLGLAFAPLFAVERLFLFRRRARAAA